MSTKNVSRILLVLLAATWAMPSLACPVCFGDSDSPMAKAVNLSVVFMVIVTYVLILGGVATVIALRLKARRKMLEAGMLQDPAVGHSS